VTRAGVLIVGGSIAGVRTAEGLRRLRYGGTVTILEESGDLPYDRPALSKQILTGDGDTGSVRLRSAEDLDKAAIELRRGHRAVGLDTATRTVTLHDGSTIGYDDLVVATGASPRMLPGADAGVHYVRTLADAVALRVALAAARRVVVVGAGFIGSEVAAAASGRGAHVTVVEPFAYPLSRVLGDAVGAHLARLHAGNGVELVTGRSVTAVAGGRVTLDDGSIVDGDIVVVGVGAVPNTAWLNGSGLDVADGVVCDAYCRTSAAHVYAAGDVSRWPNALFGEPMRIEHWTNAVEQAGVVAWNIANPDRPRAYTPVPYVWSDQYGSRLQIVGRPRADDQVRVVHEDGTALVALYIRDGALVGAFALNAPQRALALRRSLAARTPLAEVLGEFLTPVTGP
jgi:NADPH-dependent 2,4-dienoyl-CoA reductase/sulfur reductase-like enzyme